VIGKSRIFKKRFTISAFRTIDKKLRSLSLTGKAILYTLSAVFIMSSLGMLWNVNSAFIVDVPRPGGRLIEGVIGLPRFINPALAITDADKDISALVYSGLMRVMPDGTLGLDLAQSYTISPDGKVYTFALRTDAKFHDGTPVSADDVVFTIQKIQDQAIKSTKRVQWEGIMVEKTQNNEVRFTLHQPYAPFLENTTLGILPKHKWESLEGEKFVMSEMNVNPIGSGPFKVSTIERNDEGVPSSYTLEANKDYYLGVPNIKNVVFKFYTAEKNLVEFYQTGDVNAINTVSPENASILKEQGATVVESSLPRIFAVFFNQNVNKTLGYKEVREALSLAVNRQDIITNVLKGYGTPLDSAVPKSFTNEVQSEDSTWHTSHTDQAINLLENNGWQLNANGIREKKVGTTVLPLAFSISTSDAPELKQVADMIVAEWKKLGAQVSVRVVEGGYLNQNVIKPRKYDALLFGQVVNRDLDLYAFWHSSQRADPGLNVALYNNTTVDKILESMRAEINLTQRKVLYSQFAAELRKDVPAVFLYSPNFIYVVPQQLGGISLHEVSNPSERFTNISQWYLNTDRIWKIFAK
jgi:peptide/nickel transport system substrate-binding protein